MVICQLPYTHCLIHELCTYLHPEQRCPGEEAEGRAEIQPRLPWPNLGQHTVLALTNAAFQ